MDDALALIREMAGQLDYERQLLIDDRSAKHPLADRARAWLAAATAGEEPPT